MSGRVGSRDLRVYVADEKVCIGIRVSPSARCTRIRGVYGDRLKVEVAAPAEDNRANRELGDALAGWLGMDRNSVSVVKGHRSRNKVVAFSGIAAEKLRSSLDELVRNGRATGEERGD